MSQSQKVPAILPRLRTTPLGAETYDRPLLPGNADGHRYRNVVSEKTREHEDKEIRGQRSRRGISWVKLARNRIAFRHDARRGPISATLTGAVY